MYCLCAPYNIVELISPISTLNADDDDDDDGNDDSVVHIIIIKYALAS